MMQGNVGESVEDVVGGVVSALEALKVEIESPRVRLDCVIGYLSVLRGLATRAIEQLMNVEKERELDMVLDRDVV